MPTYEYACKKCGEHVEAHQSFSDPPLTKCPACKGPLRKVFGNIAISFKGSGFYKTDSRAGNGKGPKKDAEKASATAESSPSSDAKSPSSDAKSSDKPATPKPAAKSDKKSPATPAAAAS